jgi:hypothetical protein
MELLPLLTIGAVVASAAASTISAMTGWWNWRHLKEMKKDLTVLKAQAARQLALKDKASDLRERAGRYKADEPGF